MGGLGAIPFEVADRYAERYDVEDFDEFWTLIRAMDDAFLKEVRRRSDTGKGASA
jgi:hypothetical protein